MQTWRTLLALLTAVITVGLVAEAQETEPSPAGEHPLVELNLKKFGFERYRSSHSRWPTFVDFIDNTHLAVAWLTPDDRAAAASAGPLSPTPAHLHVVVLNAVDGNQEVHHEWPTPSTPVRFLGLRDGKFLTCTGNVLRIFSSTFEIIRERELPDKRGCLNSTKGAGISPSRNTLIVSWPKPQSNGRMLLYDSLLDLQTFAEVANWTETPTTSEISDHWLIGNCHQIREPCIRGINQTWEPLPGGWRNIKAISFLDDQTLGLNSDNRTIVMRVNAETLFQFDRSARRFAVDFVTSVGGERFAVVEDRLRGVRSEPLDMYPFQSNDRVVVYSIPDRRAIYAVKLQGDSPWAPWISHINQLALSPNGALLALTADNTLKLYRLPHVNSSGH